MLLGGQQLRGSGSPDSRRPGSRLGWAVGSWRWTRPGTSACFQGLKLKGLWHLEGASGKLPFWLGLMHLNGLHITRSGVTIGLPRWAGEPRTEPHDVELERSVATG